MTKISQHSGRSALRFKLGALSQHSRNTSPVPQWRVHNPTTWDNVVENRHRGVNACACCVCLWWYSVVLSCIGSCHRVVCVCWRMRPCIRVLCMFGRGVCVVATRCLFDDADDIPFDGGPRLWTLNERSHGNLPRPNIARATHPHTTNQKEARATTTCRAGATTTVK